jgi:hypothetical protein
MWRITPGLTEVAYAYPTWADFKPGATRSSSACGRAI